MNNKRLFIASLPWSVDDNKLRDLFATYGNITYAKIVTDRETGRSRGFGFVEFSTVEEAEAAMVALNGSQVEGRAIKVNVARPQENR